MSVSEDSKPEPSRTQHESPLPPSSIEDESDSPGSFGQEASRGNGLDDILVDSTDSDSPMETVNEVHTTKTQADRSADDDDHGRRSRKRQRVHSPQQEYDPKEAQSILSVQAADLPTSAFPVPSQPTIVLVGPEPAEGSYVRPAVVRSTTGEEMGPEILMHLVDAVTNQIIQAAIGISTGTDATLSEINASEVSSTSAFLEHVLLRLRGDVEILARIAESKKNEEEHRKKVAEWTMKFGAAGGSEARTTQTGELSNQRAGTQRQELRLYAGANRSLTSSVHATRSDAGGVEDGRPVKTAELETTKQEEGNWEGTLEEERARMGRTSHGARRDGMNALARLAATQREAKTRIDLRPAIVDPNALAMTGVTARPAKGFPQIHVGDSRDRVRNVEQEDLEAWEAEDDDTKVVLEVFGDISRTREGLDDIAGRIRRLLKKVAGAERFTMTGPKPENGSTEYMAEMARTAWLVSKLRTEVATRLCELTAISTRPLTIIISKRAIDPPRFICSLKGLGDIPTADVKEAVRQLLRDEMNIASIQSLILNDAKSRLKTKDPLARARYLVETIDVTRFTVEEKGRPIVIANLYMDRPTSDADEWDAWRTRMVQRYLNDPDYVSYCYLGRCSGCHGVDHKTDGCPFSKVPGWNGVTRKNNIRFDDDAKGVPRAPKAKKAVLRTHLKATAHEQGPSGGEMRDDRMRQVEQGSLNRGLNVWKGKGKARE
ncbi:hypothetical protein PYCCODRAFT_1467432 [Trametes coccinea BRFM310]|uniref:Uncharacterized protein n=1 Tax=Trametes coccinea (strain BRFM310) TaxID=1353009 RepID=A0A1Y2IQ26_TRAC3|nr:hypothetical protein PYCCODRAFT_1467432 [Trametes coccinea BRFM310]